jgi:hypothetical protein
VDGSGTAAPARHGRVPVFGVNASLEGGDETWSYGLSITGARTRRITPEGESPLTVAPQVFGNARISYDLLADRALDGGFPVQPKASANVEGRLTISGDVPVLEGLNYRLAGSVASAAFNPYVAGPNQSVGPDGAEAELTPINRLTIFLTLEYHLFQ